MSQSNLKAIQIQGLIPPNPAALDFESKFRENLEAFLSQMIVFEEDYQDTIAASGGEGNTLGESISLMQSSANANKEAIRLALESSHLSLSTDKSWTNVDGSETYASGLMFDSLNSRFKHLDDLLSAARVVDNGNGATYLTIQGRFDDNEIDIKTNQDLITNAYSIKKDTINPLSPDTSTSFTTIEQRFSSLEDTLATTGSSLSSYAQASGSSSQDFNTDNLTVAGSINLNGVLDMNFQHLLNVPDPTNSNHVSTKNYVDNLINNKADKEGDSSVLFKVMDADPQGLNHDPSHAVNYNYATTTFAKKSGESTEDFDAQNLNISASLNMNNQFITNLPDPTTSDHAVSLNYLTSNYTDNTNLNSYYASKLGNSGVDFNVKKLSVNESIDMNSFLINNLQDPVGSQDAVTLNYLQANYGSSADISTNYAAISGSSTEDFSIKDLNLHGNLSFLGGSGLNMSGQLIENLANPLSTNDAANKSYVDTLGTNLDGRISALETGAKLPDSTGYNAKFLMVKTDGSGITWADPPDLDPSLMVSQPYDWVPSVPWQSIQFDGEVYSSRSLAAGFTYFVAGDLRVADFDSNGDPVILTVESGSGSADGLGYPVKGAVLIVQGHVIGNLSGIDVDATSPHKGRLVVLNWSDSKADYIIPEVAGQNNVVRTSQLNLTGKHQYNSKLVMEANTELIIDTNCDLIFKESELDPTSTITIDNDSNGDPFGTVSYFDPIKIIENAPAALDTLQEVAAILEDPNTGNVVNLFSKIETDVQAVATDAAQAIADAAQAQAAATQAIGDAAQAASDAAQAAAGVSNVSIGNLVATTEASTGDLVYKFSP